MKRKCCLILCLLYSYAVYSQELKFDEMLSLQKKSFIGINDYLVTKGWEFSHSKKGGQGESDEILWAFGKRHDGKAKAWLTLCYDIKEQNILVYQVHDMKVFSNIKAKINAYNMQTIESEIDNNSITSVHEGANYVVILTIESELKNVNATYSILLINKDSYHYMTNPFYSRIQVMLAARIEAYENLQKQEREREMEEEEQQTRLQREEEEKRQKLEKEISVQKENDGLTKLGYKRVMVATALYNRDMQKIIDVPSNSYVKILNKNTHLSNYYYVQFRTFQGYVSNTCFDPSDK